MRYIRLKIIYKLSKILLEKYESGGRIELEDLDFSDIKCPHTEIDILKGLK